jgi:hypothetical protein
MATTYTLISSNVLSSSAASVTFSAIPATYTDLVLRASVRCSNAGNVNNLRIQFNSDTSTNYSETFIRGNGATATSSRVSSQVQIIEALVVDGDGSTANTFGNVEMYIPSYTVSQSKPISTLSVQETNATTANIFATANLWRNNAAVTSIYIEAGATVNMLTGSSFYLYGISNA